MDVGGGKIFYCGKNNKSQELSVCLNSESNLFYYSGKKINLKSCRNPYLPNKKFKKQVLDQKSGLLSLRNICVEFVVQNFHLVDSLIGFPELIGEELFKKCFEIGYFEIDSAGNWKEILNIFIDAYSDKILKSLNLSGHWLFLSVDLEYLLLYIYLNEADFSYCKIGDDHEILLHLGKLNNLEILNLGHNQLSVNGIKNLTMNNRRCKTGLKKLKHLRLDGNKLTDDLFLPFLQDLPALEVIVLDDNYKKIENKNMKLNKFSICPRSIRFHENVLKKSDNTAIGSGWAVPLIQKHISNLNLKFKKQKENLNKKSDEIKKRFYNNKSKTYVSQNSTILTPSAISHKNHVILCKCLLKEPVKLTKVNTEIVASNLPSKKRTLSPSAWNSKTKRLNKDNVRSSCDKETCEKEMSIDKSILDLYC